MATTDDYYRANADKRAQMLNTHRGDPHPWAIAGYIRELARQAGRTPTHRGAPRDA